MYIVDLKGEVFQTGSKQKIEYNAAKIIGNVWGWNVGTNIPNLPAVKKKKTKEG